MNLTAKWTLFCPAVENFIANTFLFEKGAGKLIKIHSWEIWFEIMEPSRGYGDAIDDLFQGPVTQVLQDLRFAVIISVEVFVRCSIEAIAETKLMSFSRTLHGHACDTCLVKKQDTTFVPKFIFSNLEKIFYDDALEHELHLEANRLTK